MEACVLATKEGKEKQVITDDEIAIVVAQLQSLPYDVKIAIGDYGSFDKGELIEHVESKDEIGRLVVDIHMSALRSFKEGRHFADIDD